MFSLEVLLQSPNPLRCPVKTENHWLHCRYGRFLKTGRRFVYKWYYHSKSTTVTVDSSTVVLRCENRHFILTGTVQKCIWDHLVSAHHFFVYILALHWSSPTIHYKVYPISKNSLYVTIMSTRNMNYMFFSKTTTVIPPTY